MGSEWRNSVAGWVIALALTYSPASAWAEEAGISGAETPRLTMDIGGYGSFRYDASDAAGSTNGITLRRFVLTTDARIDRLQVYSELEFERFRAIEVGRRAESSEGGLAFEQELEGANGSEIALEQMWAQLNLTPSIGFRVGAVLVPVGRFNARHDDNVWNLPRRPLMEKGAPALPASVAWTEMGIGLAGEHPVGSSGLLSYQAYLLNGVSLDFELEQEAETRAGDHNLAALEASVHPAPGAFDGSNKADAVAARVAFSPTLGSEVGISGYTGTYTPDYLAGDARLSTIGVDGSLRAGRARLEGEWIYTRYGGLDQVLTDFAAVARDHETEAELEDPGSLESELEIKLSGLSNSRTGFWVSVEVPFVLRPGILGFEDSAIIPVTRYERVWYDGDLEALDFSQGTVTDRVQRDRKQDRISLGLAFRPVAQAVFHLVYEQNRALKGDLLFPETADSRTHGMAFGVAFGF